MKYFKLLFNAAGLTVLAAFFLAGCGGKSPQSDIFKPVRDQAGDFDFTLCEVTGFDELTLSQKQFAHHLSRAAVAGDPIAYQQIHPDGYRVKLIIDGIVSHTTGMEARLIPASEHFAKIFWANHGSYDRRSGSKYIPEYLDRPRMQMATLIALSNGADIGFKVHKVIQFTYNELEPIIFDSGYEPDLAGGRIKEWDANFTAGVCRAGNDTLPSGAFSVELSRMADQIRSAMDFAEPENREALDLLAKYYETGVQEYFDEYSASSRTSRERVGFIFDPVVADSLNPATFFSSLVFLRDDVSRADVQSQVLNAFADAAADYPDFSVEDDEIEVATAQILTAAGYSGYGIPPACMQSYNEDGGRQYRVIVFTNVMDQYLTAASEASGSVVEMQDILSPAVEKLLSGKARYRLEPATHLFITPFTQTVTTKMGKVTDVILDYPASVIEYGIKISDLSRVLPADN